MSCRKLAVRNLTVEIRSEQKGNAARSGRMEYSPRRVITNLSFEVSGGESLALVGESGAGKSMTCLSILDLLPAGVYKTGGSVFVNDRDVGMMGREEKRRLRCRELGVIMQNPMSAFDPVFTVYSHFSETMKAGGRAVRDIRRRAADSLGEVGLEEGVLDAYPFQLSGGMLQRIMIALALVHDPEYLIADEPTTDLDVVAQKRVLDIIRERCAARHLGLLIITHDLSVARYMAGRVAIMRGGEVVESGLTSDVFSGPVHAYARELISAHNRLYSDKFIRLACAGGLK